MKPSIVLIAVALAMAPAAGVLAQSDEIRTERVAFPAGASGTTIRDTITGYDSVLYEVGAEAGQHMSVSLAPSNAATYFNVYTPGRGPGDEALANSQFSNEINTFDGILPQSGVYTISVYMVRAAARRNETSNYTIDISVTGDTGALVQGDFADGLEGGPDFWRIATSGGPLNLRAGPSAGTALVTALPNGTGLKNLGCRMAEGRRWCRVATLADPGFEGWAAGDFLVEGSGEAAAAAPAAGAGTGGTSTERLAFAAGTSGAELIGSLAPGESRRYALGASNGQFLYVRVATGSPDVSYQIFNPDGSFLLDQIGAGREYRGQLWQSGDHVVEVINRGGSAASYNVIFGIE